MKTLYLYLLAITVALADPLTSHYLITNDLGYDVTIRVVRVSFPDETQYVEHVKTMPNMSTWEFEVTLENEEEAEETLKMQFLTGDGTLVGNSYLTDADPPADSYETFYVTLPEAYNEIALSAYIIEGIGRLPTPDDKKTLWIVKDVDLTGNLYREGIDKLVYAFTAKSTSTSSSGGMTKAEFQSTKTDAVAQGMWEANQAIPEVSEMETQSADARAAAETAVTQVAPSIGSASIPSAPSIFAFAVGDVSVDLDPLHDDSIALACAFVKAFTGWALLVTFSWFCWNEFSVVVRSAITAHQAHGNAVVGGTGAQATALVAAGIIAAIFVGIPAAYWASITIDFTPLNSNPFNSSHGTPVTAALYLLGCVFPYDVALTLLAAAFVVKRFSTVMILGVNAAIKFIVP